MKSRNKTWLQGSQFRVGFRKIGGYKPLDAGGSTHTPDVPALQATVYVNGVVPLGLWLV